MKILKTFRPFLAGIAIGTMLSFAVQASALLPPSGTGDLLTPSALCHVSDDVWQPCDSNDALGDSTYPLANGYATNFTIGTAVINGATSGTLTVDITDTEAGLFRKNNDGGDVARINTTDSRVEVASGTKLTFDADFDTFIQSLADDALGVYVGNTQTASFASDGVVFNTSAFIGDTANTKMTTGLTINQGAADNEAFALKSSDVAHGYTTGAETDTYFSIAKRNGDYGGTSIKVFGEDDANSVNFSMDSFGGTPTTGKVLASNFGLMNFNVYELSGGSIANTTADANILSIRTRVSGADVTLWMVDEDGDTFQNGGATLDGDLAFTGAQSITTSTGNLTLQPAAGGNTIIGDGAIASTIEDVGTLAAAATTFAVDSNMVTVAGDGGGNTVATITGGVSGQILTILFSDANITITDTDAHTENTVDLSGAFTSADDTVLQLLYDGTSFYEISRSVN